MHPLLRKLVLSVLMLLFTVSAVGLWYYLPSSALVHLVGTEVKRGRVKEGVEAKDVRYVIARDLESGETLMFRNEDIAWPPHFKFNSGTLAGTVLSLKESKPQARVRITYYGWRIPFLSAYPNITDLEEYAEGDSYFPWFNVIFLTSLGIGLIYLLIRFRKFFKLIFTKAKSH